MAGPGPVHQWQSQLTADWLLQNGHSEAKIANGCPIDLTLVHKQRPLTFSKIRPKLLIFIGGLSEGRIATMIASHVSAVRRSGCGKMLTLAPCSRSVLSMKGAGCIVMMAGWRRVDRSGFVE